MVVVALVLVAVAGGHTGLAEDDDARRASVDAEGAAGADVVVDDEDRGVAGIDPGQLRADRYGIFSARLAAPPQGTTDFRARLSPSGELTLPFSLRVPPTRSISPFGCGGVIRCRGVNSGG